ncbi:amidase [Caulobacter ginsengisoli]|uniref:Amidase n=1 Tax=Caulobacter ginsengisoli TaxID=400775 RepID=A0ABU0ISB9_9CAUL|nr:amidase family protein [Caulobacter ginsengisoli]MDQ0464905.1 amidase [Caulobacter ginsengisoli]
MPLTDLTALDATAQLQALQSRRISAVELLKIALAAKDELNPRLNAVVATDVERALESARAVDDLRTRGEPVGLLAGLPMTVKDSFDVVGMPASSGLKALLGRMAPEATVVARARRAGAVIWGKTNLPVMAGDWQTYNDLYGTTNNPWDLDRGPGGSSGGAAAALAAGITALEIGSDIGGSLRTPASFCGVFSHKPTWGLLPQKGHVPPAPGSFLDTDLGVMGPMARSGRDLRLLFSVLEDGPFAAKAPPADLKGLRVGLWLEEPGFSLDNDVCTVVEAYGQQLAEQGAQVRPISRFIGMEALFDAYLLLLMSVVGAGLPPGARRSMALMRGPAKLARSMGAGPMSWAASTLGMTASHAEWLAKDEIRMRSAAAMAEVFHGVDVIVAPIAPVPPFPHDHRPFGRRTLIANGKTIPYPSMLQWISLATVLGLPATAVPAGLTGHGLPVGVQIIGPRGGDARTLAVAQACDENIRGFVAPPALAI